jgi:hypothetical protein
MADGQGDALHLLLIGAPLTRRASFLHMSHSRQIGAGNRCSDAIAPSLNIRNHFEIPHGVHAPAVVFAAAKRSM